MKQDIRSRDGTPFDFKNGVRIKGVNVSGPDGGTVVGIKKKLTDTVETKLQDWIYSVVVDVAALQQTLAGTGQNQTAVDQLVTDNSDKIANTKFVQSLLASKLLELTGGTLPTALNTLEKIAAALNNDPNFYATVMAMVATKANIVDIQTGASTSATAGANVSAITAAFVPAITTVVNATTLRVRASGANTSTTPTFTPNSGVVAAKKIVKGNNLPLAIGDIAGAGYPMQLQWDAAFDAWVLLNPAYGISVKYATSAEAVAGTATDLVLTPASLKAALAAFAGSAPDLLNTVQELAAAINNDPNFYATMMAQIGTKAPINSPTFTGNPTATTPPTADSSDRLATTAFAKAAIAEAAATGGVGNASTTSAGIARLATVPEATAGTSAVIAVTPAGMASALAGKVSKLSPTFTGNPTTPTQTAGTQDDTVANTTFVQIAIDNFPVASEAVEGKVELATVVEAVAGTDTSRAVTPAGMAAALAATPPIAQATTSTAGKSRYATSQETIDGTLTTAAVTPAGLKAAIDLAKTGVTPPPVFSAPSLTGAAEGYTAKSYVLGMSATPVNGAISIASFAVSVVEQSPSTTPLSLSYTVTATSNAGTQNFTVPEAYINKVLIITVTAKDNTNAVSQAATKNVTFRKVVVAAPSLVSPANLATGVSKTPTLSISGFGVNYDADVHSGTIWEAYTLAGAVETIVWNSGTDTVNKLSVVVPGGLLTASTQYYWRAKFVGTTYGQSSFMTAASFTTAASVVVEIAKLIAAIPQDGSKFGHSVAMSTNGAYIVVGAPNHGSSGAATIFNEAGSIFSRQSSIYSIQSGNLFGTAVAMAGTGDRVAITAPYANGADLMTAGTTRIYTRSESVWSVEATLEPLIPEAYTWYGWSAAFNQDGTTLFVGVRDGNGTGDNQGYVYVFVRSGTTWTFQAKLVPADPTDNVWFGYSVACSADGNTAVFGCPSKVDSGRWDAGVLYVFTRTGSTWTQRVKLMPADLAQSDYHGLAVAMSGDGTTIAAASPGDDDAASEGGSVYIYTGAGAVWTEQTKIISPNPVGNGVFGRSVALDYTGSKLSIGAAGETHGSVANKGAGYIYERSNSIWSMKARVCGSDIATGDYFGFTTAMSADGARAAFGAYCAPGAYADQGAVYIFSC
jgi:hypothetical protein